MKVDKVQQNHYAYSAKQQRAYTPSFKAGSSATDRILKHLPGRKALKFMEEKLMWVKGEIGSVGMTAIGTGLVAPWPIAFNPFVKPAKDATEEEKQDLKNTKIYTALRQPISAVLAAIFQIVALLPIDKFLDFIYNDPEIAKWFDVDTNQSVLNNDGYLKQKIKKEMKAEGHTRSKLGKKAYKEELKSRMNARADEQLNNLAERIKETHRIQVGEEFIENKKVANILNEQIDGYIKDARKLKIDPEHLVYYSERAKVLMENEQHIKEIFKNLPTDEKQLEAHLKDLLSKEKNPDIKILIEEILDRAPDIRKNRADRTIERIGKIKHLCNGKYSFNNYMDAMARRNAELDLIITKLEMGKIKDVQSATPRQLEEAIKKVAEACHFNSKNPQQISILHDTRTFGTKKEELFKKIYKDVAKGYKKFVANSYKSANQILKIVIGVCITLPITCNVLNWVYPRFMNLAFPRLAGAKAKQSAREKEVE